jgi:uncharacterized iron-regulated protein
MVKAMILVKGLFHFFRNLGIRRQILHFVKSSQVVFVPMIDQ